MALLLLRKILPGFLLLGTLLAVTPARAQNYPWLKFDEVVSGLQLPVDIQNTGDGSGRLFVVEQGGFIRIIENDQLLATPFLDIAGRVASAHEDVIGLLGLAFPPGYATVNYFYVFYTQVEDSHGIRFYFAPPYHSWERGTNENTNGLIRQYLPKGCSMENLTQRDCDRIADKLNDRPRKRHNFYTPAEKFLN